MPDGPLGYRHHHDTQASYLAAFVHPVVPGKIQINRFQTYPLFLCLRHSTFFQFLIHTEGNLCSHKITNSYIKDSFIITISNLFASFFILYDFHPIFRCSSEFSPGLHILQKIPSLTEQEDFYISPFTRSPFTHFVRSRDKTFRTHATPWRACIRLEIVLHTHSHPTHSAHTSHPTTWHSRLSRCRFWLSAMTHSVVSNIAAELTAFSRATLSTFAGSIIPAFTRSVNSPVAASNPWLKSLLALISSTTQSPL